MKRVRDMDLFRSLMLEIEEGQDDFDAMTDEEAIAEGLDPPYSHRSAEEAARLDMHLELISEAGFVQFTHYADGGWSVDRITGRGHDFLDSVRDPTIWAKTKDGAAAAGGWTLQLLADLGKGLIRQQIKKHTGVEL